MKNIKFALAAALGLALAFTFSCSGDDSGSEQTFDWCITANGTCLAGPHTSSTCNGSLSNSCTNGNGSSPSVGGSSSSVTGGGTLSSSGGGTVGGIDAALNGTWAASDEEFKFNNGSFEASTDGIPAFKGTYTASSGRMTITITQVYGGSIGLDSKWYSRADLKALGVDDANLNTIFSPQTGTYSISGNNLTLTLSGLWGGTPSSYTKVTGGTQPTPTYSIDGIWESDHGIVISIYDGKAVFTNIDALAGWKEVEKKGNIKIGDSYMRNITKTGDLTWSYENLTYLNGTLGSWLPGTITLNPNGQTFIGYTPNTSNPNVTFTRKNISVLDGTWESDHGIVISIYDGKAVFINIDALAGWKEVEKKGNIKIGDSYMRNITKTGDLTWSYENLTYLNGTLGSWLPGTITLNPNGQTFIGYTPNTSNPNVTFTRK